MPVERCLSIASTTSAELTWNDATATTNDKTTKSDRVCQRRAANRDLFISLQSVK